VSSGGGYGDDATRSIDSSSWSALPEQHTRPMPSGAVPAVDPWAHMDAQEQTLLVAPETGEVISEPPAAPRVARSTAAAPAAAGGASPALQPQALRLPPALR
jgi:S-DNA-T family DNA segregation ATPase FtsK/SpoIIIE